MTASRQQIIEMLHGTRPDVGTTGVCIYLRGPEIKVIIAALQAAEQAEKQEPVGIDFYEREFYTLSNFSAFRLRWKENDFPTSEQAYQWEKFSGTGRGWTTHRWNILSAPSAHEAFKYAEKHKDDRRADWDDIKVFVMRDILHAKTEQHEYVRRKLLETGVRELIECSWRDDFWGWGPNHDGQNMLGKLWMEIRTELQAKLSGAADEKAG